MTSGEAVRSWKVEMQTRVANQDAVSNLLSSLDF
jgi:hypothetical protein